MELYVSPPPIHRFTVRRSIQHTDVPTFDVRYGVHRLSMRHNSATDETVFIDIHIGDFNGRLRTGHVLYLDRR